MRVVPPLTITDAILTSTSVAESEPVYASGTTYAAGDQVRGNTTDTAHTVFRSLQASNSGHALTDTAWWEEVGPTNRWKMFDLLRNTGTVAASPMTIVLTPGQRVNSLALVGLEADAYSISVIRDGQTVYTRSGSLLRRNTVTWSDYFFGAFVFQENVALFDLPPYVDAEIHIELTRSNGDITCGGLIVGTSVYLGEVELNPEDDAINFSQIERDDFGEAALIPRRSIPKTTQVVWCDKANVNKVRAARESLNAVPALWSGLDDATDGYFEALLIVGIYRRFTINLAHPSLAQISLELEEI